MATNASSNDMTAVPSLEGGDCLTRDEFERRYDAMRDCKKAELIEGIVYLPSPVRLERHGEPHANLGWWLATYKVATPGVRSADNTSNRLDLENEPQPDCMLFLDPRHGGQVQISDDDYVEGAPELIAEVSGSSVSYDSGPKLRTYRRHGVKEYLIWRVDDEVIEWNELRNGQYVPLEPNADGVLCSEAFPGLWLDANAMLRGKLDKVLGALQAGLALAEHAVFIEQLKARAGD